MHTKFQTHRYRPNLTNSFLSRRIVIRAATPFLVIHISARDWNIRKRLFVISFALTRKMDRIGHQYQHKHMHANSLFSAIYFPNSLRRSKWDFVNENSLSFPRSEWRDTIFHHCLGRYAKLSIVQGARLLWKRHWHCMRSCILHVCRANTLNSLFKFLLLSSKIVECIFQLIARVEHTPAVHLMWLPHKRAHTHTHKHTRCTFHSGKSYTINFHGVNVFGALNHRRWFIFAFFPLFFHPPSRARGKRMYLDLFHFVLAFTEGEHALNEYYHIGICLDLHISHLK